MSRLVRAITTVWDISQEMVREGAMTPTEFAHEGASVPPADQLVLRAWDATGKVFFYEPDDHIDVGSVAEQVEAGSMLVLPEAWKGGLFRLDVIDMEGVAWLAVWPDVLRVWRWCHPSLLDLMWAQAEAADVVADAEDPLALELHVRSMYDLDLQLEEARDELTNRLMITHDADDWLRANGW